LILLADWPAVPPSGGMPGPPSVSSSVSDPQGHAVQQQKLVIRSTAQADAGHSSLSQGAGHPVLGEPDHVDEAIIGGHHLAGPGAHGGDQAFVPQQHQRGLLREGSDAIEAAP
jgi:hypothetical protein